MDKQIFAALEIADHELRFVLGEFFNTRFNVLKVERVDFDGINNLEIQNKKGLTEVIHRMLEDASAKVGVKIEKVLLSIPSKNARRVTVKVTVPVESIDHKVSVVDVKKALHKAMQTELDQTLVLVNAVCTKFSCNGITTRKIPIGEFTDEISVQVDLLFADKDLTYDIVSCVEDSGCSVLDISLDCYAIAKEAALFEQTVEQNVILLKLEQDSTTLAYLYDGKLVSSDVLHEGYGKFVYRIMDEYNLPIDIATRLCKFNGRVDIPQISTTPIYIWSKKQVTYTISEKQLYDSISENVENWCETIFGACKDLIEKRKTTVVITGEGAEIQGLDSKLRQFMNCEVKKYSCETLGVRSPSYSCTLGLFYAYKDQLEILGNSESSVNLVEFEKAITYVAKPIVAATEENKFTGKLRSILFDNKERN